MLKRKLWLDFLIGWYGLFQAGHIITNARALINVIFLPVVALYIFLWYQALKV